MMTLTIHEGLANVILITWLLGIPLYWLVEITRVAFLNASRTSQEEVVSLDARVVDQVTLRYLLQAPLWPFLSIGLLWVCVVFWATRWVAYKRETK
jgi:hypothetical protein